MAYTIQTNGTGLDEEWFAFLKEKDFLVGLSMDGVRKTHDENRVDYQGEGTFSQVFANVPGSWRNTGSPSMCCVC